MQVRLLLTSSSLCCTCLWKRTCCWLGLFPPDGQPNSDPDFGADHGQYHLPADKEVQVKLLVSSFASALAADNTGGWESTAKQRGPVDWLVFCVFLQPGEKDDRGHVPGCYGLRGCCFGPVADWCENNNSSSVNVCAIWSRLSLKHHRMSSRVRCQISQKARKARWSSSTCWTQKLSSRLEIIPSPWSHSRYSLRVMLTL